MIHRETLNQICRVSEPQTTANTSRHTSVTTTGKHRRAEPRKNANGKCLFVFVLGKLRLHGHFLDSAWSELPDGPLIRPDFLINQRYFEFVINNFGQKKEALAASGSEMIKISFTAHHYTGTLIQIKITSPQRKTRTSLR